MASPTGGTGNLLLDALDPSGRARLLEGTHPLELHERTVLHRGGDTIDRLFFPTEGVLSLVTSLDGGSKMVEAATIGREGMSDAHTLFGRHRTGSEETVVQVPGSARVVPIERLEHELNARDGRLQAIVHGYVQALFLQVTQSAACNAVHDVTRRCARWLLQVHDRVDADTFALTQEYLAVMLGVERSTVTVAAGALARRGLIEYSRGSIRVTDREGLEAASCECYEKIRAAYSRVVPIGSA